MKTFSYISLLIFIVASGIFLFLAFTNDKLVCGEPGSPICIITIPVAFIIFFVCLIALLKAGLNNRK
jgi:hypothetical protein